MGEEREDGAEGGDKYGVEEMGEEGEYEGERGEGGRREIGSGRKRGKERKEREE